MCGAAVASKHGSGERIQQKREEQLL